MMKAYKTSIFTLMVLACLLIAATKSRAQNNLGWNTFDYGVSTTLGPKASIFSGELDISSRIGIPSAYGGLGSLLNGTAGNVEYLHDDNWLVGGIGTSTNGIRGDLGSASELVFNFHGSARLDSLALTISGLSFGSSAYDKGFNLSGDDPMLWFNTSSGIFSITEQEISLATSFFLDGTTAGAENGYVDFAYFTSKMGLDTTVSSFGLRETTGHVWVKDIYVGDYSTAPVPEPGSAMLIVSGALLMLRRRRPKTTSSLSSRLAVG
jgi:hypothetical protein